MKKENNNNKKDTVINKENLKKEVVKKKVSKRKKSGLTRIRKKLLGLLGKFFRFSNFNYRRFSLVSFYKKVSKIALKNGYIY